MRRGWFGRRRAPAGGGGDRATAEDVLGCFRLLLGRNPGAEELRGHLLQVGNPLADVVGAYLGSQEFRLRRLGGSEPGGSEVAETVHGFRLHADRSDAAVGACVLALGEYEPHVTAVFGRMLRPGLRVIDIGANIGWFSMLAASRVGTEGAVLAVEPNPLNARLLEASRRLNGFAQVSLLPVAAGRENGALALHRSYSNGSTSGLDRVDVLASEIVPVLRLDDVAFGDARPVGLVKVDVEGAEASALGGLERTLRRDRPVLISEFAPGMMEDARGYAEWLLGLGYALGVIGTDGAVAPCPDAAAALAAHAGSGVDHIDLVATPS